LYQDNQAELALGGYFSADRLTTLPRLGNRWLRTHAFLSPELAGQVETAPERVVAALPASPGGEHLVRSAAALADGLGAELVGVRVREPSGLVEAEPAALKRERELLTKFGGQAVHTARAHAEAESLARLVADSLVADPQLVAGMVSRLRGAFDLDGVAVLRSTDSGWATEQSAGSQAAISRPEEATYVVGLDDNRALMLVGDRKTEDGTLLQAFVGQLRLNGRQRQLGGLDTRALGGDRRAGLVSEGDGRNELVLGDAGPDLR
jgi:two-component system sensor histidine kinase KdpD